MKHTLALAFALLATSTLFTSNSFAASDALANETVTFAAADGGHVLDMTASNVRRVFELFQPGVDSSSRITSPKVVSGTSSQPRLQVSIRACVLIICKTVDIDADVTIQKVAGQCAQNLLLRADLRRSSSLLANNFDSLDVQICMNRASNALSGQVEFGSGSTRYSLQTYASAHRAPGYSGGPIASTSLKMLKLQTSPTLQALHQALSENGAADMKFAR